MDIVLDSWHTSSKIPFRISATLLILRWMGQERARTSKDEQSTHKPKEEERKKKKGGGADGREGEVILLGFEIFKGINFALEPH